MKTTNTDNKKQGATTLPKDAAADVAGVKSLIADLDRRMALAAQSKPSPSDSTKNDVKNKK